MIKYIVTRLIGLVMTLIIIISLLYITTNFSMMRIWMRPYDFRSAMSLVFSNYLSFIKGLITSWDWGVNLKNEPVWPIFLEKVPVSLRINVIAFIIYAPLGIGLGIIAAVKKGTWADRSIGFFTMIFSAIPSFIMIFAIIYLTVYLNRWLPYRFPTETDTVARQIKGYIIPILALSLGPIASLSRVIRGELAESLTSEFILLAKIKGLNKRQLIFRHGLRNAMVPVLPEVTQAFIMTLTGAFFIEIVYSIQGVAKLFLRSLFQPFMDSSYVYIDTHMIVLIGAFYMTMTMVAIFLLDVTYALIDPRIKIGSKK
ncbi:MAG: ABC transporter permease [Acholeplasmataceae bacterium]